MSKKLVLSVLCLVFALSLLVPLARGKQPLSLGLDLSGGAMVTYRPNFEGVPERFADVPRPELLAMAKETLTGRLLHRFDTLPDVVVRSDGRIAVSLPGEHDQRRVLETIGKTYRLTFRQALAVYQEPPAEPRGLLLPYEGRWMDLGEELLEGGMLDPRSIRVESAAGGPLDGLGHGAAVAFEFRPPYDERFAEVTRESVGRTLAILLDGEVEWAGRVEEEIAGPGLLRGGYTLEEAAEVAALLRSGDLPLSLAVESVSGVGPTLGQELLGRGELALGLSVAALALIVLVAYGHRPALLLTGWASLGCLLFFTLGLIATFGLTVDLVAIAGLVLSVGMGMDAFILVFEALEKGRAEGASRSGSPLARLRQVYGFRGEGRTLVHANATTLLVVLLLFAPERLRSFALFLVVGIAASLLTVLVTRGMLAFFARRGWLEDDGKAGRRPRGPLAFLRGARPGLFRLRPLYFAGLGVFLLATGLWLQTQRSGAWLRLGADFQPGMQLQVTLPQGEDVEALVEELREAHPGVEARYQAWEGGAEADRAGYLITLAGASWQTGSWEEGTGQEPVDDETEAEAGPMDAPQEAAWQIGPPQPGPRQESGGGPDLLTFAELSRWLAGRDAALEGVHSIDARLSGERLLGSLGVLVFSFLLLGLYLGVVQKRLDAWLAPAAGSSRSKRSRGGASSGSVLAGTVLAVLLDVAVVLAALALLDVPLGLPVVAALLTIVGYSVNDSMVLWSHLSRPGGSGDEAVAKPLAERIREGVDAILSRAVLTSLSTMVPAAAILAVGLEPLRGFAWAVAVGTAAGTLSSIFVVASFVSWPARGAISPAGTPACPPGSRSCATG